MMKDVEVNITHSAGKQCYGDNVCGRYLFSSLSEFVRQRHDCMRWITHFTQMKFFVQGTKSDTYFDVIHFIHKQLEQSTIIWTFEHVYWPQDDSISWENLSPTAKVNVKVDATAKTSVLQARHTRYQCTHYGFLEGLLRVFSGHNMIKSTLQLAKTSRWYIYMRRKRRSYKGYCYHTVL